MLSNLTLTYYYDPEFDREYNTDADSLSEYPPAKDYRELDEFHQSTLTQILHHSQRPPANEFAGLYPKSSQDD